MARKDEQRLGLGGTEQWRTVQCFGHCSADLVLNTEVRTLDMLVCWSVGVPEILGWTAEAECAVAGRVRRRDTMDRETTGILRGGA